MDLMRRVAAWRHDPMRFVEDVLTHPDGRSYGHHLDPWQREDLEAALTSGKSVWWERPRGHSKTQDMAAVFLAELALGPPGSRLYLAAVDQAQAALAFDSLRGFVNRSPFLRSVVRLLRHEAVVDATDSVLTVLPADAPGSWGLRPRLVGLDELASWRTPAHEEFAMALLSSLGKVRGARAIIATTAHWDRTSLCWRLREQVQHDPAWIFSRRGQCASWIRPEFLEQQRRILPEHVYRMLHENEWTEAGAEFLTWQEIESVFDPGLAEKAAGGGLTYTAGLDVGLTHDRTALAVAHMEPDGTVVVDKLQTWQGRPGTKVALADVEAAILDLAQRFRLDVLVCDPYQAVFLAQRLQAHGLRIEEYPFTASNRARLFSLLLQFVRAGRLRSYPHEGLRRELAGLRWVEKGGVLRPDHPASGHDDLVVAVGLALQHLAAKAPPESEAQREAARLLQSMRIYEAPWATASAFDSDDGFPAVAGIRQVPPDSLEFIRHLPAGTVTTFEGRLVRVTPDHSLEVVEDENVG